MVSPALRAILLSPPTRPPAEIMSLFASGEKGVVVVPQLKRYNFQDAAMTIPAVVGMPVAKSVCPATGVVTTWANVTLQRDSAGLLYFAANGSSSSGQTPAIDFSGTDKLFVAAGVHKASDAAAGTVVGLGPAYTTAGCFEVFAPGGAASTNYVWGLGAASASTTYAATAAAPITGVLSCAYDIAGAGRATEVFPRVNGAVPSLSGAGAAAAGTGNFTSNPIYFMSRAASSVWLNGRLYGAVARGGAITAGQRADVERYMVRLTGVNI